MSGARRVLTEMGDEGEELSKSRYQVNEDEDDWAFGSELTFSCEQIINVWRPLAYPAVDCPLAAIDYRTLDAEKDLVPTDLIL